MSQLRLKQNLNNILESVIDTTRKTLDPLVFDKQGDQYVMRPNVVSFVQDIVDQINNEIVDVNNSFIKGSILSFQWLDNTDVDLLLEVSPMGEDDRRRIQDEIDSKFMINIPGTEHPLQIYVNPGKYDINNADGVYKLDDGWVKGPYNIAVNIENYMNKFNKMVNSIDLSTGELKRNIIDYNILKNLPQEEIKGLSGQIKQKLSEIDKTVEDMVFQYKHIRNMRHDAFSEDMTPQQIAEYGTKNALPENVVFKLMERYYYLAMMRKLKALIDNNDIDTDEEVEQVQKSIEQFQFGD
jgi:hypothetical protein